MNRRSMLRASAAALGGAGATVAGLRVWPDTSSAETGLSFEVVGDHAVLDADKDVAALWLSVSVDWAYDLPNGSTPDTVVVEIAAGDDALTVVDSAESPQLFGSADGSESFETDLLGAGAVDPDSLTPDGEAETTEITIEARLRVEDSAGNVLARESTSDTATLTIERDALDPDEYGSIGGSGSLRIEST